MYDLFMRTLSQGLQAFAPVAFWLAWRHRLGDADASPTVRWSFLATLPVAIVAGYLFATSTHQARWESIPAVITFGLAIWFAAGVLTGKTLRPHFRPTIARAGVAAALTLVVVRQAMEIVAVFIVAAFDLRSVVASLTIAGAAALALLVSGAWTAFEPRLSARAASNATRAFAIVFLFQVGLYALHESAEARFLPWSDTLHAATEPYGPEASISIYVSALLVLLPAAIAAATRIHERVKDTAREIALAAVVVVIACVGWVSIGPRNPPGNRIVAAPLEPAAGASPRVVEALASTPHVLFRHTRNDRNYGKLGIAPLDSPSAARAVVDLSCDRVSFSSQQGICLQADRGVHTTYRAVLFDDRLAATRSFELAGSPSRTRISADGRYGAITVFLTGQQHGYTSSSFSTQTMLVDMAAGRVLDDLEHFATWRNGMPFVEADFNFWGVTFTRDSNVFYASLQTRGRTYLVRGNVSTRTLTVAHDDVECPSLSPDNRLIAFKRRVSPVPNGWRVYLLDLATMKERRLAAESRYVDDQIAWLDNDHLLYALPHEGTADVWVAAVEGNEPARIFLGDAESPIVVQ